MGVRGLTTFIARRSDRYLENHHLHDSNLVLDGNSIASQLYNWHCKRNDCFGGDYDKYAHVIESFFKALFDCNVTPLVVFDGGYEKRKIRTVFTRLRDRIRSANRLDGVTEGSISVFPLFLREVFVDIALRMGVKCVRCDFEGDSEAACLARTLNCPVLSYDSDFYIFDVMYIPFSSMDIKVRKKCQKNSKEFVNYLECQVYKVEKFLNSFGGMDKVNLPIFAALLGNDYVKKRVFAPFYRHLKLQKGKGQNEQQRRIKTLIQWLKNETSESAFIKILGRFKMRNRRNVARQLQAAIKSYYTTDSELVKYFDIASLVKEKDTACVSAIIPDLESINTIPECNDSEGDEDSQSSSTEEEMPEEVVEETTVAIDSELSPELSVPQFFKENYRKCLYPSCFIDMITAHTYYFTPQVEDSSQEHSHIFSTQIITTIHQLLTQPCVKQLTYVARNGANGIKRYRAPHLDIKLPLLQEIGGLSASNSKSIFLDILNVQLDFLLSFPNSWHLFIISLKYWMNNVQKINFSLIYSLILCGILLSYSDKHLGFYRSTRQFLSKYGGHKPNTSNTTDSPTNSIIFSIESIDLNDSVSCMKKLIPYFEMDVKMQRNPRHFDRTIVHSLAQFQSCLLHIKYLNSLLNSPFPPFVISDFYDGTFIYNMSVNLNKRSDVHAYLKLLLESCPKVLNTLQLMVEHVQQDLGENAEKVGVPRKRRRKRNSKKSTVDVVIQNDCDASSDEEAIFDENNSFSILAIVNK